MSDGKVIDGSKTVKRAKMHPEESYEKALNVEDEFASTAEFVPPSEFNFSTRTCCFCNGYYGPCFEEPVCPTCHTFLFPNDMDLLQIPIFSEKTDDEDSGNDEPTELYYNYERRTSQQQPQQTSPQSSAANVPNISNLKPHVPRRFTLQHEQTFNVSKIGRNGNDNDVGSGAATSYNKRSYPCSVQSTSNESNEAFLESWKEKNRLAGQFIETRGLRGIVPLQDAKEGDSQCQGNNRIVDRVQETTTSYTLSDRLDMLTICKQEDYEAMSEQGLVEALPPEVLLVVFSHLDDVSLWSAANVCRRWCGLISTHITSQQWQQNVKLRWPLYKPIGSVKNWYKMYDFLASSAPCRTCLSQTCLKSQSPRIQENSWRKNRLHSELKNLRIDPPEGIEATPLDQMCCHWQATITGPVGSPYEGGLFYLYLQVPCSYPLYPPIVRFLTKILHPNVSRHGDVGIDSIHHNWSLALTISKVLISVQSLLTDPYCQVCMEPELGEMYLNDRERFDEIARTWTWQYAMHDVVTPL